MCWRGLCAQLNRLLRREMSVVDGQVVEATLVDPAKANMRVRAPRAGSAPVAANASVRTLRRPMSTSCLGRPKSPNSSPNGQQSKSSKLAESPRIAFARRMQSFKSTNMREQLLMREVNTTTGLARLGTQPNLVKR